MAEAEDVITDVARHATVFAQDLWRRHRAPPAGPQPLCLADVAQRLDLLIAAVFGRSFALRVAQPPAPPTWLKGMFLGRQLPPVRDTLPATDGNSLWLPVGFGPGESSAAIERFRTVALQQATRAWRGSAAHLPAGEPLVLRELYLLLEARAADDALVRLLPGMARPLYALRQHTLRSRPPLAAFAAPYRPLEALARAVLDTKLGECGDPARLPGLDAPLLTLPAGPVEVLEQARLLCVPLALALANGPAPSGSRLLWRDLWTGDLRPPPAALRASGNAQSDNGDNDGTPSRSARLAYPVRDGLPVLLESEARTLTDEELGL